MLRFNFAETKESKFSRYIRLDILFLVLIFLFAYLINSYQVSDLKGRINQVSNKISHLEREIRRLKGYRVAEKQLLQSKQILKRKLEIVKALDRRRQVPKFLYFFSKKKNLVGVWLNKLNYKVDNLKVEANTFSVGSIPQFFRKIETDLGVVKLKDIKREEYKNPSLKLDVDYYKFRFDVRLKNGASH